MHALAGQRIEIGREGGHQGLTLARTHLRDIAEVQRGPAHELDVVVALTQGPSGCLAHRRESLGQQVIQALTRLVARAVFIGKRSKFRVGQLGELILKGVHRRGDGAQFAEDLPLAGAKDLVEHSHGR